jgi:Ni,Fe-hydrogenase I cytochrome b subunit
MIHHPGSTKFIQPNLKFQARDHLLFGIIRVLHVAVAMQPLLRACTF